MFTHLRIGVRIAIGFGSVVVMMLVVAFIGVVAWANSIRLPCK